MKSSWLSLALCSILLLGAVQAAQAAPRKADAGQLLQLAEKGLSGALQAAASSEGRLDRSRAEQRPFWSAMDKMDAALDRVREATKGREQRFFRALERGSEALGELRVVWARTGVSDPGVSEGIRILSGTYELLRSGYGREAVRNRQNVGLTEAERQRFFRIQRAQERFAESLRVLQEKARQRGDAAMLAELQRMADEANRIAMAQASLEAYLNALLIADAQRGEWTGNSQFAPTQDRSEWLEAGSAVEELYTEQDVSQVLIVDLGNVGSLDTSGSAGAAGDFEEPLPLSYLDEPTEVPETLASAVEDFEPARELDPFEEEEALAEEEMEEAADSDLEVYDEVMEGEEGAEEILDETTVETELLDETAETAEGAEGAETAPTAEGDKKTVETVEVIEVEDLPVPADDPAKTPAEEKAPEKKESGKPPAKKETAPAPKKDTDPPGLG